MGQAPNKYDRARNTLDDTLHDDAFRALYPPIDGDERLTSARIRGLAASLHAIVDAHEKRVAELNAAEVMERLDRSAAVALFSVLDTASFTTILREAARGQLIRYVNTK